MTLQELKRSCLDQLSVLEGLSEMDRKEPAVIDMLAHERLVLALIEVAEAAVKVKQASYFYIEEEMDAAISNLNTVLNKLEVK